MQYEVSLQTENKRKKQKKTWLFKTLLGIIAAF